MSKDLEIKIDITYINQKQDLISRFHRTPELLKLLSIQRVLRYKTLDLPI